MSFDTKIVVVAFIKTTNKTASLPILQRMSVQIPGEEENKC